jgi:ribokinase
VFTAGSQSIRHAHGGSSSRRPGESPPYPVEVVDSAGAGDSFRGGLIYGLLQGWPDGESVRIASAVAALVCTTAPGCLHPPAFEQVTAFLSARGFEVRRA